MTLIATRGLPGAGKSRWATQWVKTAPGSRVRVNRDDLRLSLFGYPHGLSNDQEQMITRLETATVEDALKAGKDVVVDAMHLRASYVRRWQALAAKHGADFRTQDFPVPVKEAIRGDMIREMEGGRRVGMDNILKIAQRFKIPAEGTLPPVPEFVAKEEPEYLPAPPYDPELPTAWIVDIDGTLANLDHRSPYAKNPKLYLRDDVYEDVAALVRHLGQTHHIICVSGRLGRFRDVTLQWLLEKCWFEPDLFYMRPDDDERTPDNIIKSNIFDEHIAGAYNVVGVLDDRARVLRMWRAKGLTTFRVGDIDAEF